MGTDNNSNDMRLWLTTIGTSSAFISAPSNIRNLDNLDAEAALNQRIRDDMMRDAGYREGKKAATEMILNGFSPDRILKCGPATIVMWKDGTKTVVKCAPDEEDNLYAAYTAALAIKICGSNNALKKLIERKVEYRPVRGKTDESEA